MKILLPLIGFYDYTVILTYASMCSALFGMLQASRGCYTAAILCLLFSGVCDMFDGMVARSKPNRTQDEKSFGIQLDSLCDLVSFGVFPAFLCYHMGVDGPLGYVAMALYCLCAVIRLAFFNVQEENRQRIEGGGCNKFYRGLPVTSIAVILPLIFLTKSIMTFRLFRTVLHIMLFLVAFLFVLDFPVKKPDWKAILSHS